MLDSILKRLLHPGKHLRSHKGSFLLKKKLWERLFTNIPYDDNAVRLSVLTITILIFSGCGVSGGFFDGCLAESFTLRQVRQLMQHTVFQ